MSAPSAPCRARARRPGHRTAVFAGSLLLVLALTTAAPAAAHHGPAAGCHMGDDGVTTPVTGTLACSVPLACPPGEGDCTFAVLGAATGYGIHSARVLVDGIEVASCGPELFGCIVTPAVAVAEGTTARLTCMTGTLTAGLETSLDCWYEALHRGG